jgi:hypothetical protein
MMGGYFRRGQVPQRLATMPRASSVLTMARAQTILRSSGDVRLLVLRELGSGEHDEWRKANA